METEAAERDPEAWNVVATDYEATMATFTAAFANAVLEAAALPAGARVLEVAAGTGAFTTRLPRDVAEVLATDFAPAMVARLEANLARANFAEARAAVMDAQRLELPDGAFDAAFCLFALPALADPVTALHELHRVLRVDGRVVVTTWAAPERCPCIALPMRALRAALPVASPGPKVPGAARGGADGDSLARWLDEAGFRDVRVDVVSRLRTAPSAAAYWEAFTSSSPPANAVRRRMGSEAWREITRTAVAFLEKHVGTGPVALAGEALVASGCRGDATNAHRNGVVG